MLKKRVGAEQIGTKSLYIEPGSDGPESVAVNGWCEPCRASFPSVAAFQQWKPALAMPT